ncbi:MAG: isoprenylcysteine carboxylmethyltransferase family protein [Candidatus Paceibacterota bacterium]
MGVWDTTEQSGSKNLHKNKVHKILAHSYLFFFISFLFSLFLDFIFPVKIFDNSAISSIGAILLVLGTLLILWAQKTSHNLNKDNLTKNSFSHGPYRFTRSPTHYGLFLLILGFGFVTNAFFIIVFSVFSFFITKFIFIRKEEKILAEKYGAPYLEYKKSVSF